MKKIILLLIVITRLQGFAQDIIIKNDKSEIKSKVTEITETAIKYKQWDNLDGPIYNIAKTEVFMIIYQNGKREVIENNTAPITTKPQENLNQNVNPTANSSSVETNSNNTDLSEKKEPNSLYTLRMSTNTATNAFDVEGEWKFKIGPKKNLLLGLGTNSTVYFNSNSIGYYYYASGAYRCFLSPQQKFPAYIWFSAGIAYTESYDLGEKYTTPSSFLWETGLDAPINKKGTLGFTVYTTEFSTAWLGLQINF